MTIKAAKRKIIPLVVLSSLAYTSYRALAVVKADPGILACNMISGTSLIVSSSGIHRDLHTLSQSLFFYTNPCLGRSKLIKFEHIQNS